MKERCAAHLDAFPQAHRLALELECLLLSCQDNAAVSKWWDSAHEALEQWREFCSVAPPEPAPQQEHDFYKTGDKDAPEQIKDRNGEVVLWYCRRCKQAEADLMPTCPVGAAPLPDDAPNLSNDVLSSKDALELAIGVRESVLTGEHPLPIDVERLCCFIIKREEKLPNDVAKMVERLRESHCHEAADMLERLAIERANFHMEYRMKCDVETKALNEEVERLARQVPEGCVVAHSRNIIACRDALLSKDSDEAYHQLYWSVDWADPYNPWKECEDMIAAGQINLNQGETK